MFLVGVSKCMWVSGLGVWGLIQLLLLIVAAAGGCSLAAARH